MRVDVRGRRYDVPPGYVLVEWVGEESPLDDEWVKWKMATRQFNPDQLAVLREMARIAVKPHVGHVRRTFNPGRGFGEIPHLSKRYVFGNQPDRPATDKRSTIQMMTANDARLLTDSESGNEFRVYDNAGTADVAPPRLVFPKGDITITKAQPFRQFGDFRRALGSGWRPN